MISINLQSICQDELRKLAQSAYARRWYVANRGHSIAKAKAWQTANRQQRIATVRRRRQENPGARKAESQKRYARYGDKIRDASRVYSDKNKERIALYQVRHWLMRGYGLTYERFGEMLIGQSGRCAICHHPLMGKNEPHVDHCHATDRIRGLLCNGCNLGLGFLKDSVASLRAAIDYLEQR